MGSNRRFGRRKVTLPDRRAAETDIPAGARVFVDAVEDPYGVRETVKLERGGTGPTPSGATEWQSPGQPKIQVIRALSSDPLSAMWARKQIDEAQFVAGRKWQSLYDRSCVGLIRSVDTTREPVDGGQLPDPITEGQRHALSELDRVAKALGKALEALVVDVLGRGLSVASAAQLRGNRSDKQSWGFMFRQALDTLAGEFGFATVDKTLDKGGSWC